MRTKKSFLNLLTDIIPQILIAILSFVRIKLFLNVLGTEQLGVYQLFGQILPYLSLAEMGLTSAVLYTLYKPISEKNHKKISALIVGTKKMFNKVMFVMLIIGLILSPNVKFLIADTTLSNTFIMAAFILTMLSNVIGYLSTPYVVLFDSNQEKYKYNFWIQIIMVSKQVIEILLILVFGKLFVVLFAELLFAVLRIIFTKILFNKNYKYVDFKEKPDTSFMKKTKELIPHKIGTLIANNIDVLITSKFLGLTAVVSYNCYYYIINVIIGLVNKFSSATLASIGNLIIEDKNRAYNVFLEYSSMLFFIATIICIPLGVVISPFVDLWYGGEFVVSSITVYLFVFNMFYGTIRIVLNTFAAAAGIFKETIKCTFLEIIINLVLSLLLVKPLGIKGLLIGTSVSLVISEFLIKPFILNNIIFNDSISKYYLKCFKLFSFAIVNIIICSYLYSLLNVNNLLLWFIYSIIIFIVNAVLSLILYKFTNELSFIKRIKFLNKKA